MKSWNWMKLGHSYSSHELRPFGATTSNLQVPWRIFPPKSVNHSPAAPTLWIWKTRGSIVKASPVQEKWIRLQLHLSLLELILKIPSNLINESLSQSPTAMASYDWPLDHQAVLASDATPPRKKSSQQPVKNYRKLGTSQHVVYLVFSLRLKHLEVVSVSWNLLFLVPENNKVFFSVSHWLQLSCLLF